MFSLNEAVNQHLVQFVSNKDRFFYEQGIMKLTERRQKVIEQTGNISSIDLSSFKSPHNTVNMILSFHITSTYVAK